ncbi:division/cell wall cluster transcriptional repressor MraZ [Thermodesulfobacteriota bacterium]
MFRGRSDQSIDAKGRIMLPVKFRDLLLKKYDNTLVLTNFDNCLIAYPTEEWIEVEDKVRKLPSGNKQVRAFKRFFISGATECSVDKQGRVLVPPSLKSYAQLEKDIVIAGQINHFEIWNRERFYENIQHGQDFEETEEISDFINDLEL